MARLREAVRRVLAPAAIPALAAWERIESGVAYVPRSKQAIADPYPLYARMRETDPVHRMRLIPAWALTRYEDVDRVLRNHRLFSSALQQKAAIPEDAGSVSLLNLDPPDHTRLRALVSGAFTPAAVERLRPRVETIMNQLLDAVGDRPCIDLIAAVAHPLPVRVMAEMLGVPSERTGQFQAWSDDLAATVDPFMTGREERRAEQSRKELSAYFGRLMNLRRDDPRDDIVSTLLAAREDGERLSAEELRGTLNLLLVAGNETTKNLIGNGMLALLEHPDQMQLLREDPSLAGSAVQEMLRYDAPVQIDQRTAARDVAIGGKRIRGGTMILTLIGAANRDPEFFERPDAFDIGRERKPHLSFGRGIHYCLGASLAEMEAEVAFGALLERFTSLRLAREPVRSTNTVLRGTQELWVHLERKGR